MNEPNEIKLQLIPDDLLRKTLSAVESFLEQNDQSELDKLRSDHKEIGFLVDAIVKFPIRNPRPIYSVLRIICKRYKCFALVEYPYFDLDVWACYSKVYSSSFTPYGRTCHRIHFFESTEDNASQLIVDLFKDGKSLEDIQNAGIAYKGFMTIRPPGVFGVGKTAIKFDDRHPSETTGIEKHSLEKTGIPFCRVEFPQEANVMATRLQVNAVPFIQQDPSVGVCASAALWSASQVLSSRFGLNKFSYDTITDQALYSGKDHNFPPRKDYVFGPGLSVPSIVDALSFTGATVKSIYLRGSAQAYLRLTTYTFVESGIPAILCYMTPFGGHAVTLLGHLLPSDSNGSDIAETNAELTYGDFIVPNRHHLVGQGVQLYYGHNDAYGPFDRFHLLSDKEAGLSKQKVSQDPNLKKHIEEQSCLMHVGRKSMISWPDALVLGLPRYVQNTPETAILRAIREFDSLFPDFEDKFRVLWRCLLVKTSDFKQSIFDKSRLYPAEISKTYASLHLPLFVWLVEFTVSPINDTDSIGKRRDIDGEFLFDTSTPNGPTLITQRIVNLFRDLRQGNEFKEMGNDVRPRPCFILRNH